jgi:hypothetical protein
MVNKVTKKIMRVAPINKRLQLPTTPVLTSTYKASVWNPEYMLKAKLPKNFGRATLPFSRHITVPVSANSAGLMWFAFQPYFLQDNSVSRSTLFINTTGYNGIVPGTTGAVPTSVPYGLPAGSMDSYTLISASLIIQPQANWTTITGKIGGCSCITPEQIQTSGNAGYTENGAVMQAISNVQDMATYAEADLQCSESLRFRYSIADLHDLEKYQVNSGVTGPPTSVGAYPLETTFIGFVVGAPGNAAFNFEIYLNYEVTTFPGSAFSGMAEPCSSMEDPQTVHMQLSTTPGALVHPIKGSISRFASSTVNQVQKQVIETNELHAHSGTNMENYLDSRKLLSSDTAFFKRYGHTPGNRQPMESVKSHASEIHDLVDVEAFLKGINY